MRFYTILHKGNRVVFTESRMRFYEQDTIYIPSAFDKIFDPYICWRALPKKDNIHQMIMKDLDNEIWLVMKCKLPLNKVLTASSDVSKEMR
jgi:hypothetical protein